MVLPTVVCLRRVGGYVWCEFWLVVSVVVISGLLSIFLVFAFVVVGAV